jgi:hypothetical protein
MLDFGDQIGTGMNVQRVKQDLTFIVNSGLGGCLCRSLAQLELNCRPTIPPAFYTSPNFAQGLNIPVLLLLQKRKRYDPPTTCVSCDDSSVRTHFERARVTRDFYGAVVVGGGGGQPARDAIAMLLARTRTP